MTTQSKHVLMWFCLAASAAYAGEEAGKLIRAFTLRESFGVPHPTQIVEFLLPEGITPGLACMVGPDGKEVPFQVTHRGTIAVQTDLPAGAERTWKLFSGRAPGPFHGVLKITRQERNWEIMNGLTGVRIPIRRDDLRPTPAPVQGIRYRDGRWTATGPNVLPVAAKSMEVLFQEQGPLRVILQVTYKFDRPDLKYGNKLLIPGGEGTYRSIIEVQAGQPSILFEEEADTDLSYSLNLADGLAPTQARYRGHHSSSKDAGYEADGRQYRMWHERPALDAFVDLTYEKPWESPFMAVWNPWIVNSGWYWQLYDAKAGPDANLVGVYARKPSLALGAAFSGVRLFTRPQGPAGRAAGITVALNRRCPDARVFPRVRFAWGLFVGVKGEDLKDPLQVQPIARQMNLHGGINLNKLHGLVPDFPDPKRGYGSLYMDPAILKSMIARLRQDQQGKHGRGYYGYLYGAEPSFRDTIDMWADTSGKETRKAVANITSVARDLVNALVNGDGIYDFRFHYWHGGLEMSRRGVMVDCVLANDLTSPEDRAKVKAAAVLFGSILWDDDFVPLFAEHGLNLGTENMPVQQQGYRDFYALFLAEHPAMQERAKAVERRVLKTLHHIVNEHGAEIGSVHYVGASFSPTLNVLLQTRMLGRTDPFKTEDRLAKFAEFYMSFLTPPEPRFGGARKLVAIGDGSTEASEIHGCLATGFREANPDLSARLMGAWNSEGKPHSGFFGSTLLMIDEAAPAKSPNLGSASFPGWCSVLRTGWGTPNETAVWFVNGGFYRDHSHNDLGSLVIYALGAPLSIDWGPIYSPQVPGGFMHDTVLAEPDIGHPWDADGPPLNAGPRWGEANLESFLAFRRSSHVRASFKSRKGTVWTRSVHLIHTDEARPIILIDDKFSGPGADEPKALSLMLMAEGGVETPAGPQSPPPGTWSHDKDPRELPSAGRVFELAKGANRLGFKGQWLIDWDLFTLSDQPLQAHIGNWAHTWHPGREASEFRKATGRPFEERQHILRVRGNGSFGVAILPRRKDAPTEPVKVTRTDGGAWTLASAGLEATLAEHCLRVKTPGRSTLAVLDGGLATPGEGVGLPGGPVELVLEGDRATVTAHGPAGRRRIVLPGAWKPAEGNPAPLQFDTEAWVLEYRGGPPLSVSLEKAR